MLQPLEMKQALQMKVANDFVSTTTQVWNILKASYDGNLDQVKKMVTDCPELLYAQYNYTPPIHFAVREGHLHLVDYLLQQGALDPSYKIYPFQESLVTIAKDREHFEIERLLENYLSDQSRWRFKGDTGEIFYSRNEWEEEFEKAVGNSDFDKTKQLLDDHPELALDQTFFWGEGVLMMVAKKNDRKMVKLLMSYGATVPEVLKWTQFYYFEKLDMAVFLLENGMSPNVMSWHHVSLLHDMAQKGTIEKAKLLLKHGAGINAIDEEYQSTPLGMAARWGHGEMVDLLLRHGADPNKSGAAWSTPLSWSKKKCHKAIEKTLREAGAR
jgi:ankyrin repeat protein